MKGDKKRIQIAAIKHLHAEKGRFSSKDLAEFTNDTVKNVGNILRHAGKQGLVRYDKKSGQFELTVPPERLDEVRIHKTSRSVPAKGKAKGKPPLAPVSTKSILRAFEELEEKVRALGEYIVCLEAALAKERQDRIDIKNYADRLNGVCRKPEEFKFEINAV